MSTLSIKNLNVATHEKHILKGVNLKIESGKIHAIMGPNGSGKSTLAKVILGHPAYTVQSGSIEFDGKDITSLSPDKRAKKGLFLAFQSPQKIPGLPVSQFLRTAYNAVHKPVEEEKRGLGVFQFQKLIKGNMDKLKIDAHFTERYLNEGFSGGEMKKTEILQMALLKPKIAILDEIDSGLDVDALKIVCKNIVEQHRENGTGILLITHYNRILDYLKPDFVHVMVNGKLVQSGDAALAQEVEEKGYNHLLEEVTA